MEQAKRERLESKGWKVGTVSDFLELTREETILIEIKKILNQIGDKNSKARDLEIDNLSTLLEYEQLSNVEQIYVVEELIKILRDESDPAVIESIFNLLGIAFESEKECYKYNDSEQSFLDETTLLSGKSPFDKGDLGG